MNAVCRHRQKGDGCVAVETQPNNCKPWNTKDYQRAQQPKERHRKNKKPKILSLWPAVVVWMRRVPVDSYVWILGPPVGRTIWEDWKVWPWRRCVTRVGCEVSKDGPLPMCLSVYLLADEGVSSQLFLPLCLCSTIKDSIASETISPNETLSFIRGYLGVPSQKWMKSN